MKIKRQALRVLLSQEMLKRFKLVCVENELSLPKQTEEIIKKFVEIQEDNLEKIKMAKKEK